MATFNIKNPYSNTGFDLIADKASLQNLVKDQTFFGRNSGRPIVYSNYPEKINWLTGPNAPTAENDKCLCQREVAAGETYVFYSHNNRTGKPFKLGIQIHNPTENGKTAEVTKLKYGYGNYPGTYWDAQDAAIDYLNDDPDESQPIGIGGNLWICEHAVPANSGPNLPFCGHLLFDSTVPVIVTIYIYTNQNTVTGTATMVPYNTDYINVAAGDGMGVYSGYGDGYILDRQVPLTIENPGSNADSFNSPKNINKNNYWFMTGEPSNPDACAVDELTPITIENGQIAKAGAAGTLSNVGNWGTQYNFSVTINNKLDTPKTVYGFMGSMANRVVIKSNSIAGKNLSTYQTWRFFEETIPAKTAKTFDYTYMVGSLGTSATGHMFSLSPTADAPPETVYSRFDVNKDSVVDMSDVDAALVAFMTEPGDANWNAACDVNYDGIVDILDLALIRSNFTPVTGVNITGQVKSYNPKLVTILQLNEEGTQNAVASTTIDAVSSGSDQVMQGFTFESIPTGDYDLEITKEGNTKYTITGIPVDNTDIDLTADTAKEYSTITLSAGDIGGDGQVGAQDLTTLLNSFGGTSTANPFADINGDGLVSTPDLTTLLNNLGRENANSVVSY